MVSCVIKRDGTRADFDLNKIVEAVNKCFLSCRGEVCDNIQMLVDSIKNELILYHQVEINIETIQDIVEKVLMRHSFFEEAKSYILYRKGRSDIRGSGDSHKLISKIERDIIVKWGPIGYPTYKRTYARRINETTTEEFDNTILRVLNAANEQLHVGFTNEEIRMAYRYLMELKCSVAGRFLWQLGTKTVDRYGLMSLQNCAFVKMDQPIFPFLWVFDVLMLGVGVGVSVENKHISKLPPVINNPITITRLDTKDADFIVPDSREGWVSLVEKLLEAYFFKGKSFTYSTILIRGAGSIISGFGGTASGPEELCKGLEQMCGIFNRKLGQKLSSVDCLDLICILAAIVVSGNVRRSALLILGDHDDLEYLSAKRWDNGNIPNWRSNSNNSVVCSHINELPDAFWEGYQGNGEPYGLINLGLARKVGRLKDGELYPDENLEGFNPCCEQGLANFETCCLGEIFLPNISDINEFKQVITILYRICKHSLTLPCHHRETETIVHKNMRIGLGITGYLQCTSEQKSWLSDVYEYLREYDKEYSIKRGFNPSIKLTTVKPSGTLSLLAGVTPGIHSGLFRTYIRRIRFASSNNLYQIFKSRGYHVEYQINFDGSLDHNTVIVEFPCKYPDHTVLAKDMTAVDQLNVMKEVQTNWSDNAVSVTIYYSKEELPSIKEWLKDNFTLCVKSVSFLLKNDHGFKQAPYEEISLEKYEELIAKVKPVTNLSELVAEPDFSLECSGGACPIR